MAQLENYPLVRQLLEAVGLSVFHTLWAGCLLLLLLIIVLKVMPTSLAKARFTVSLLALQLLFLLFLAIFFYQWNQVTPPPDPVAKTITTPLPATTMVLPAAPAPVAVTTPPVNVSWRTLLHQWSPWLAMVWLLGGLYHAICLVLGLQHTRRLRAHAEPVSAEWEKRFARWKQHLGLKSPIGFSQSGQAAVPLTFGWLKPVVLIPASLLTQLAPAQVEMIVLHELAHIRRRDYLWSLSQSIAEIVLFYHPAYWYIARVLEREREFACDQMTVGITQQPETYAHTLLQVASATSPTYGLAVSGKRGLSARIKRIVAPNRGQRSIQVMPMLVLISLLGLASVTFALQLQPSDSDRTGGEQHKAHSKSSIKAYETAMEEITNSISVLKSTTSTRIPYASVPNKIYDPAMPLDERLNHYGGRIGFDYSSPTVLYLVDGKVRAPKSIKHSEVVDFEVFHDPERAGVKGIDISGYEAIVKAYTKYDSARSDGLPPTDGANWGAYRRSFQRQPVVDSESGAQEKKVGQNSTGPTERWLYVLNGQVQTIRPTFLDQDYRAEGWETRVIPGSSWWLKAHLTIEQQAGLDESRHTGIVFITSPSYRANQRGHLIHGTITEMRTDQPVPNIQVRIKGKDISTTTNAQGHYQMMASSTQDTVEFLLGSYATKVPVEGRREVSMSTHMAPDTGKKKGRERMQKLLQNMEKKLSLQDSIHSARWLYIVNDELQTDRPTVLNQHHQAAGWETRYVPVEQAYDDLTERQRARATRGNYTGVLFLKHEDYQPRHVVYGTVVKREKGHLVPDMTVRVKGKDISMTSNAHGDYRLVTDHPQDTIEFLFNGEVIEESPIAGRQQVDLTVTVDRALIEEMNIERVQKTQAIDSVLLTGQVNNWFTGEYVPNVRVVADGSATTTTNAKGQYQLRFPAGTKDVSLAFSVPGYPTHSMKVDMTGKDRFHAVMSIVREDEKNSGRKSASTTGARFSSRRGTDYCG